MERRYLPEDDPRSPLEKARRTELVVFARQNNIDDISADMPAPLMRKILRSRGITNIGIAAPPLGQIGRHVIDPLGKTRRRGSPPPSNGKPTKRSQVRETPEQETIEVDADTLAEMQWRAMTKSKPAIDKMTMAALRAEAKARGVPIVRTDKKADLLAKLRSAEVV
jgi:hypothetical protein